MPLNRISLTEALAITAIKTNMPFTTYKTLGEWLGCYNYILPAERSCSSILMMKLIHRAKLNVLGPKHKAHDLFKVWLLADMFEVTLTATEQTRVAVWMNDSRL